MSTADTQGGTGRAPTRATDIEMKLEVVVIPVTDVDRAKAFYERLGWRLDADFADDHGFRIVQFTPPGSACSIQFGAEASRPQRPARRRTCTWSSRTSQAARDALAARASRSRRCSTRGRSAIASTPTPASPAPRPTTRTYGSFASFSDPDGNTWLLQEITSRLPGRIDPE